MVYLALKLYYFLSSVRNFQQYIFNIPILCVYIFQKPSKQWYHSSFKQLYHSSFKQFYVFSKIEILASVVVHIIYQVQFSLFLLLNKISSKVISFHPEYPSYFSCSEDLMVMKCLFLPENDFISPSVKETFNGLRIWGWNISFLLNHLKTPSTVFLP